MSYTVWYQRKQVQETCLRFFHSNALPVMTVQKMYLLLLHFCLVLYLFSVFSYIRWFEHKDNADWVKHCVTVEVNRTRRGHHRKT